MREAATIEDVEAIRVELLVGRDPVAGAVRAVVEREALGLSAQDLERERYSSER